MSDDAPDASPAEPASEPPRAERPMPRGCNPLVFGIVAATIQMAILLYFMPSC